MRRSLSTEGVMKIELAGVYNLFWAVGASTALSQKLSASCDPAHEALNEPADFWPQARHGR